MRIPRYYLPGSVHHVITRFVDRDYVLDIPGARAKYLELLGRALETSDWRCLAYGFMSNHVHDVLVAGEEEPEYLFKRVHSPFGIWMNKVRDGLGPIVSDRPSIQIVEESAVAKVIAYVHNNPVRAGVARTARDSSWTSHRAYLGLERAPTWLHVDEGLRRCGIESAEDFDAWVQAEVGKDDEVRTAEAIQRRAVREAHRRGVTVSTASLGEAPSVTLVRRRDAFMRPSPMDVISIVAFVLRKPAETVLARGETRLRRHVLAVGKRLGLTVSELASAMGISRQRADKILRDDTTPLDAAAVDEAATHLLAGRRLPVDKGATVPTQRIGKIAGRRARR